MPTTEGDQRGPSGAAATPLATAPEGVWARGRRALTLGLAATITLVAFEALAISTVMPVVEDDLGGLALYGWVFSGFFLANLLGIVVAGQAADRRGPAAPFLVGLVLFSAGLLLGGLAPSMPALVAGRVVQGLGAGVIPAVAYVSVGRAYPQSLQPRVFAVFSSAWVVPGLIGPAASAAIADATSWRWVFLALLPFVMLAGGMALPALRRLPAPTAGAEARTRRSRLPDALLLTLGAGMVLAGLGSDALLIALLLVALGAPLAARAYLRLVPGGTARLRPGLPAAIAVRGILTFAFFGADAYVSLALTDVRGTSTLAAGAALTAATLLWTTGAWIQERRVGRVGPRRLVRLGFALVAGAVALLLAGLSVVPVPLVVAGWGIAGLGMGLSYAPLSVTVLGAAPQGEEGSAASSLQLSDVLGVALGTGVTGAFVALGDTRGWPTSTGLTLAFGLCTAVAIGGWAAARRLPVQVPTHAA